MLLRSASTPESSTVEPTPDQQTPETSGGQTTIPWWSPRDLTPGYFALVMASGIISVACYLLDYMVFSTVLVVIAAVVYVLLIVLNIWRLIAHRSAVSDDFADATRSFGFFTFVEALGSWGHGWHYLVGGRPLQSFS